METLDATGLKCPLPVLRAQKALRGLPQGSALRLISTDEISLKEVPLFCEQADYTLETVETAGDTHTFIIRK